MRRASVETIARVPGIGPIRARALREALDRGWTGAGPAGEAQA
jgi:DNA integrity scanning protein DisA with diadenylate cyclase activity